MVIKAIKQRKTFPDYDPRERPWYKLAENATHPVYTAPYKSTDGPMEISCAMPYYDNDGFAGVGGIACSSAEMLSSRRTWAMFC